MKIKDIENHEVREKALINAKNSPRYDHNLDIYEFRLETPLKEAFDWCQTPEGDDFWIGIYQGKDLPLPTDNIGVDITPDETKIEKGKWYRRDNALVYATSNEDKNLSFSGYKLCADNTWIIKTYNYWFSGSFTPAEDDYVIQRMQEEVNKRYSVGDVVRCLYSGEDHVLTDTYHKAWEYDLLNRGELWGYNEEKATGVRLMKDGKWAGKVEKYDQIDNDPANPSHYKENLFGEELKDVMIKVFGEEKYKAFAQLNAFKYRMRAGKKDDAAQDIAKAKWYESKL